MFDAIFPKHWTTLQRLMWLKTNALARAVYETITGNPVSFTAKAAPLRQLKVAFSPIQDLHGYDAPWPAGGGKNKIGVEIMEAGSIDKDTGEEIPTPSGANHYRTDFIPVSPSTAYVFSSLSSFWPNAMFYDASKTYISYTGPSANVQKITFTTPANCAYVRIYFNIGASSTISTYFETNQLQLETGSNRSTYSPYSNECPISGWDSLTVEQSGANLTDTIGTAQYSQDTGKWVFLKAGAYIAEVDSCTTPSGKWRWVLKSAKTKGGAYDNNLIEMISPGGYKSGTSFWINNGNIQSLFQTFNVLEDCYVQIIASNAGQTADVPVITNSRLSIGTDEQPYQPYTGRSISISLGQTVYSGTVDVVTGVLTVTMASVDLSALAWTYYANLLRFRAALPSNIKPAQSAASPLGVNAICSNYRLVGYNQSSGAGGNGTFGLDTNGYIAINDQQYTDATTFASAMQNVQLICELAEPFTIQLTPQEVQSLAGDNVLFSDANGDLTVEYRSN